MPNRRVSDGEVVVNEGAIEGEVQLPSNGTSDYEKLQNLPAINGHTLIGDQTAEDLDIDCDAYLKEGDLDVTENVGGCHPGMTYNEGTALEDIIRDILNPVAYPTLKNPSLSISGTGSKLLEYGASIAVTITATFNRGSINPAYGTSGFRSGPATSYSMNGSIPSMTHEWNETVDETHKQFAATATYSEGEQPKDSIGEDYDHPLPAGSVNSSTLKYDFVNPIWANINNIQTVEKLPLVQKSTGQYEFLFPAQTVDNAETFDIPASWTVTAVEVFNELSNRYEDCSFEFDTTSYAHPDLLNRDVSYVRYIDNRGYSASSRRIRVKWT